MRSRSQKQQYFKPQSADIPENVLIKEMGKLLETLPGYSAILDRVYKDLVGQKASSGKSKRGRKGMSAEQVLRALILKSFLDLSYRELENLTHDSISAREFFFISPFSKGFHFKTLQSNIKLIKEDTLCFINDEIKHFALIKGIEDGKTTRTDGTSIESNIHYPTDWSLMNDSIRVLTRTMCRALEDCHVPIIFTNHYKASKKKLFKINNDKSPKRRRALNLELIRLTKNTLNYAKESLEVMKNFLSSGVLTPEEDEYLLYLIGLLKHFIPLVERVVEQAHRRIVKGEKVESKDKVVSIFEEHTDIIAKGGRDVVFGHKATMTTGKSGLILSIDVHEGNPADSTLVEDVMNKHNNYYGSYPESVAFDGCYSSNSNREFAERVGIENITFSKESKKDSSLSNYMRRKLRNFRAGIEATVSMLKRMFGLTRVMNKGLASFKVTVGAAAVAYNLFILSRLQVQS